MSYSVVFSCKLMLTSWPAAQMSPLGFLWACGSLVTLAFLFFHTSCNCMFMHFSIMSFTRREASWGQMLHLFYLEPQLQCIAQWLENSRGLIIICWMSTCSQYSGLDCLWMCPHCFDPEFLKLSSLKDHLFTTFMYHFTIIYLIFVFKSLHIFYIHYVSKPHLKQQNLEIKVMS